MKLAYFKSDLCLLNKLEKLFFYSDTTSFEEMCLT